MEEKIIDSMSETALAPADFITLMFERTDEDGILYIPGWHYDRPGWESNAPGSTDIDNSYRCKIDWNVDKLEKISEQFKVDFVLSVSLDEAELPEAVKSKVIVSL